MEKKNTVPEGRYVMYYIGSTETTAGPRDVYAQGDGRKFLKPNNVMIDCEKFETDDRGRFVIKKYV